MSDDVIIVIAICLCIGCCSGSKHYFKYKKDVAIVELTMQAKLDLTKSVVKAYELGKQ